MLRNRVNTVPSVRKIELSRENFCSGEPKLINFSTCRSSLEGCGRINQHFPNKAMTETPDDILHMPEYEVRACKTTFRAPLKTHI